MAQAMNNRPKKITHWKIFTNDDQFNRIGYPNTRMRMDHPLLLPTTNNRISSSTPSINQGQNIRIDLRTTSIDQPVKRISPEMKQANDTNDDLETVSSPRRRSSHLIENGSEITRECAICLSDQLVNQFEESYSSECDHFERTICDQCIYNNVISLIQNASNSNIFCPEPNCLSIFRFENIRYILLKENNFELFERYDRQLTYKHLEQNQEFVWCAHNGCGSGQLHAMNLHLNPIFICIKCKRRTCAYHRTKWHTGMTCEEYDQSKRLSIDYNTQIWLKKYSKKCPKCQTSIEKSFGCDHMTCRKCKHQFCWQCFADYQHIQTYGLNRHMIHCIHYPTNNQSYSQRSTRCNIL